MRYTPPTFTHLKDMAAIDAARLTEDEARAILEGIRWPEGPICPHCQSREVTRIQAKSKKVRDGLIQCNACRQQFTVTVNTVMHRSHITLRQWMQAFHAMCSHKKGVSALQLQRNLGLKSYKAAWHLAHRIRFAMKEEPLASTLKGTVEIDETYVGGKEKSKHSQKRTPGSRGPANKTAVVALVERGGRVRSKIVRTVNARELKSAIRDNVDRAARLMTDELRSYQGLGKEFTGGHKTVNHGDGQYARGNGFKIHINSAESYFALLKRGIHGTFHHVSEKHLSRYCDEFSFRWGQRKSPTENGRLRPLEALKAGGSCTSRACPNDTFDAIILLFYRISREGHAMSIEFGLTLGLGLLSLAIPMMKVAWPPWLRISLFSIGVVLTLGCTAILTMDHFNINHPFQTKKYCYFSLHEENGVPQKLIDGKFRLRAHGEGGKLDKMVFLVYSLATKEPVQIMSAAVVDVPCLEGIHSVSYFSLSGLSEGKYKINFESSEGKPDTKWYEELKIRDILGVVKTTITITDTKGHVLLEREQ